MPTVGKAPRSGILFTGREPHAIHGVTLPFAVILTAHRLRSPLPAARQTASGFVCKSKAVAHMNGRLSAEWQGHVGASEARDAVALVGAIRAA